MKLTIRKCEHMGDWYVIERAEHDGRQWFERTGPRSMALRCSSRFSDADVEGTGMEMAYISSAIKKRACDAFERCSVDATNDPVKFRSPRNSTVDGECSYEEALELAGEIERVVVVDYEQDSPDHREEFEI